MNTISHSRIKRSYDPLSKLGSLSGIGRPLKYWDTVLYIIAMLTIIASVTYILLGR